MGDPLEVPRRFRVPREAEPLNYVNVMCGLCGVTTRVPKGLAEDEWNLGHRHAVEPKEAAGAATPTADGPTTKTLEEEPS